MKDKTKSLRTPLAKVRGLGSAKEGAEHWWMQRLTALALIPLSIYVIYSFFAEVVYGGYDGATVWLRNPFAALAAILFVGAGFHHAISGLQVVIEDYVHGECLKLASVIGVKFIGWSLALLATIAVLKILFFANMPMPHA